jgi:hypothetical protein
MLAIMRAAKTSSGGVIGASLNGMSIVHGESPRLHADNCGVVSGAQRLNRTRSAAGGDTGGAATITR